MILALTLYVFGVLAGCLFMAWAVIRASRALKSQPEQGGSL